MTPEGHLVDPVNGHTIEENIMTRTLYSNLETQGVDFNEDYQKWTKDEMIQKMGNVMGIRSPHDPDETYVLTSDNLVKILAIQMRFRCEIMLPFFCVYNLW